MRPTAYPNIAMLLTALCLAAPSTAAAHPHEDGEEDHGLELPHRFFARAGVGIGWASLDTDGSDDLESGGLAVAFDVAAGARVLESLALHVSVYGSGAPSADANLNGDKVDASQTLQVAGLGVGATYHILPIHAYVGFSAGLGWALLVNPNVADTSFGDVGFSSSVILGKEFPLSETVYLGGALNGVYARIVKEGVDYNGLGGGLMLTLSYH